MSFGLSHLAAACPRLYPPVLRKAAQIALTLALAACSTPDQLQPFSSDGCSLFPDADIISRHDWCSCCFEHDQAYWRGGTRAERKAADLRLRDCVLQNTGNRHLAELMYEGVRVGGSPYFYSWYRWGYGWGYDRKYQPLTAQERERANRLIDQYFASENAGVCNHLDP